MAALWVPPWAQFQKSCPLPACSTKGLKSKQERARHSRGSITVWNLRDEPRGCTSAVHVASTARRPGFLIRCGSAARRRGVARREPGSYSAFSRTRRLGACSRSPGFARSRPHKHRNRGTRQWRDIFQQLRASGLVDETKFCHALADELGVGFVEKVDPEKVVARDRQCLTLLAQRPGAAQTGFVHKGRLNLLLAADRLDIASVKDRLRRAPGLAERLLLAPPDALRKALFERARSMLVMHATGHLWEAFADCSARVVVTAWQGLFLGALPIARLSALPPFRPKPSLPCICFSPCSSWPALDCALLRSRVPAR